MLLFTSATTCGFMHCALSAKTTLFLLKNKISQTESRGYVISIPHSYLGGFLGLTQLFQGSVMEIPQIKSRLILSTSSVQCT
jgi:hypothetical protein